MSESDFDPESTSEWKGTREGEGRGQRETWKIEMDWSKNPLTGKLLSEYVSGSKIPDEDPLNWFWFEVQELKVKTCTKDRVSRYRTLSLFMRVPLLVLKEGLHWGYSIRGYRTPLLPVVVVVVINSNSSGSSRSNSRS